MRSSKPVILSKNLYQQSARTIANYLIMQIFNKRLSEANAKTSIQHFFSTIDRLTDKYNDEFFIKYNINKSKYKMLELAETVENKSRLFLFNSLLDTLARKKAEANGEPGKITAIDWLGDILNIVINPLKSSTANSGKPYINLIEYYIIILKMIREQYIEINLKLDDDLPEPDERIFSLIKKLARVFIEDKLKIKPNQRKFLHLELTYKDSTGEMKTYENTLKIGKPEKLNVSKLEADKELYRLNFKKALFEYELEKKICNIVNNIVN